MTVGPQFPFFPALLPVMLRSRKKDVRVKPNRKLDKRSSRGMVFENEELRMRTIEINAEVEKGKDDIKKLRKENDHLRREMWSLRDEYDRLEKLIKHLDLVPAYDITLEDQEDEIIDDEDVDDDAYNPDVDNLQNYQKAYGFVPLKYSTESPSKSSYSYCKQSPYRENSSRLHQRSCSQPQLAHLPRCSTPDYFQPGHFSALDIPIDDGNDNTQTLRCESECASDKGSCCTVAHQSGEGSSACDMNDSKSIVACSGQVNQGFTENEPDGFSTVQRRCRTIVEKVRTNGVETQVVREASVKQVTNRQFDQPGASSSQYVAFTQSSCQDGVMRQSVTFQRNSYLFLPNEKGHNDVGQIKNCPSHQRSNSGATVSSEQSNSSVIHVANGATESFVRIHSIDRNTVIFNVSEHPALRQIVVQDVIDSLESQLDSNLCVVKGVRIVNGVAYISLAKREHVLNLLRVGLKIRDSQIKLVDVVRDATVILLTGVPYYISDGTIATLLSGYGSVIGEMERRYYKGVDTGERLVRIRLRKHVRLPRQLSVGGSRILLRLLRSDEMNQTINGIGEDTGIKSRSNSYRFHPRNEGGNVYDVPMRRRTSSDERKSRTKLSSSVVIPILNSSPKLIKDSNQNNEEPPLTPRIDKAFEYRSQLSVNLRMSAEIPQEAIWDAEDGPQLLPGEGHIQPLSVRALISSHQRHGSISSCSSKGRRNSDSPKKLKEQLQADGLSDCRTPSPSRLKESPLKCKGTVNFEDSSSSKKSSKSAKSKNGILRKSANNEDSIELVDMCESEKLKKCKNRFPRSFSLADSFKFKASEKDKGKRIPKLESVSETVSTSEEPMLLQSQRRDSERSIGEISRSSKSSSRKSGDLPWCGCWGNGCL
ncbi:uncharacterized protein LOC136032960 isoform X4 [Artemia franciscana]|uniref:Uncharacterized protein n=1 Tax=Artemia franciscana TaxID=6661 RepID=A0AA88IAT9_ARTSF|nr:hypothetical protein QYM36_001221 [Artemia franciscana]KAK2724653.1 hypothetical protein QYM36_001221 [Artemia franciscana]KAK2724654.1 hypothetical protein QYM36_001221 [Artemia franciscana]